MENTIRLYINGNLAHELVTEVKLHQLSRLLVDEKGRYWVQMRFGSGFDYNLVEPVGIDTRGRSFQ